MNWRSDAGFTDCKLKFPILKCCVNHPKNKRKPSVLAHWVKFMKGEISRGTYFKDYIRSHPMGHVLLQNITKLFHIDSVTASLHNMKSIV